MKVKLGATKGIKKTYRRIRERYMWPGLKDQVTEFVRKCDICQKQKIVRAKIHEPMLITDTLLDTFDNVSLDTVGKLPTTPDGYKHISEIILIAAKNLITAKEHSKENYDRKVKPF